MWVARSRSRRCDRRCSRRRRAHAVLPLAPRTELRLRGQHNLANALEDRSDVTGSLTDHNEAVSLMRADAM